LIHLFQVVSKMSWKLFNYVFIIAALGIQGFYELNLANLPHRFYLNHSYTCIWLVTRDWPISMHLANYQLDYMIHARGWRFKPHLGLSPRIYTTPHFYIHFWTFHIQYVYIRHTYIGNVCVTCVCGQSLWVIGSR
jgi:hypothetical protein